MTRDEAVKKAHEHYVMGERVPETFVRLAVALGMLKLEEPKSEPKVMMFEAIRICRSAYNDTDAFVAGLEKQGYKIVEK